MKCKAGHEMLKGCKRCTECGGEPAAEVTMQKSACTGCGTAGSPEQGFCGECGDPMLKSEDLDASLDALETMFKANSALPEHVDVADVDCGDDDLLKAAGMASDDGEEIDDIPLLLLKGHNRAIDRNESLSAAILGELRQLRRENGLLAKATHSSLVNQRRIEAQLGGAMTKSVGPRSRTSTATVVHPKSLEGAQSQDESMPMGEVMVKAMRAQGAKHLDASDINILSVHRNSHCASLNMLKSRDPQFGIKIERAIEAVTQ